MKPRILLVNPPIYDFPAYDFWLNFTACCAQQVSYAAKPISTFSTFSTVSTAECRPEITAATARPRPKNHSRRCICDDLLIPRPSSQCRYCSRRLCARSSLAVSRHESRRETITFVGPLSPPDNGCTQARRRLPVCTYCSVPQVYPKFTHGGIAELKFLARLGVEHVAFYDDALLYRPAVILEPFA